MASAVAVIEVIAAVVGAGTAVYEATKPGPETPKPPTAAPDTSDAAARSQAEALMKRRGMASTMMTSPMGTMGVAGTPNPQGLKATLGS